MRRRKERKNDVDEVNNECGVWCVVCGVWCCVVVLYGVVLCKRVLVTESKN